MSEPADIAAFRFGFGLPLPKGAPTLPEDILSTLAKGDRAAKSRPSFGIEQAMPAHRVTVLARRQARLGDKEREIYRAALAAVTQMTFQATQITFARALDAQDGFRERLVRFWADHFTTTGRFKQDQIMPFALIEDAIRPHVTGRFADMVAAVTLHPAMLLYLDQVLSVGPASVEGKRRRRGLNENLGRELIELHTLGVGAGYRQEDVRQTAELLTGLNYDPEKGQVFLPDWAEPGPETVLGKTYTGEGMDPIHQVLQDLGTRPETAQHIARKLAVHFIADTPDDGMVADMAAAFDATGGDLMAVYGAMLAHPLAFAEPLQKARQPFDFMVSSLRALGISGVEMLAIEENPMMRFVIGPLKTMGQDWEGPIGPNGWAEEADAWITPQGLAARIAWAMETPAKLVPKMPDPREFATRALGSLASERLIWAVSGSENIREGVGLVLASAEFNRR